MYNETETAAAEKPVEDKTIYESIWPLRGIILAIGIVICAVTALFNTGEYIIKPYRSYIYIHTGD